MDFERFLRLIGMLVLGVAGWRLGMDAARLGLDSRPAWQFALAFSLVGAILGLIVTPWLTIRPAAMIRQIVRPIPLQQLIAGTVGLIVGLIMAWLVSYPLSLLPDPMGRVMPALGAVFFGYLGLTVAGTRYKDLLAMLPRHLRDGRDAEPVILLDTSVIIDGRIADIARTGFLQATLLVPRFVLNELQRIADSQDSLRRNRGRRGLEILNRMQKEGHVPIRIVDMEVEGREVDEKLIALARRLRCPIMTNDYNLNRVAELQNIRVLNINELANAVRTILLPGETLTLPIIQEGKEPGQGVGYLEDGTMVVVEEGRRYIGREIPVVVTKVLQTAAGRMIFARPEEPARGGSS